MNTLEKAKAIKEAYEKLERARTAYKNCAVNYKDPTHIVCLIGFGEVTGFEYNKMQIFLKKERNAEMDKCLQQLRDLLEPKRIVIVEPERNKGCGSVGGMYGFTDR